MWAETKFPGSLTASSNSEVWGWALWAFPSSTAPRKSTCVCVGGYIMDTVRHSNLIAFVCRPNPGLHACTHTHTPLTPPHTHTHRPGECAGGWGKALGQVPQHQAQLLVCADAFWGARYVATHNSNRLMPGAPSVTWTTG